MIPVVDIRDLHVFAPGCKLANAVCREEDIVYVILGAGRSVRC